MSPIHVDVPANVLPVNFIFRVINFIHFIKFIKILTNKFQSSSSHINVASKHEGAAGSFKETHSQDEPHVLKHTVTKVCIEFFY